MKYCYIFITLIICILTGCTNNPVPDVILPWTTTYTGGIDFLKEKGGKVEEGANVEGMWKDVKSFIDNDTIVYFFSNPENKLLAQFITLPNTTTEKLVEYYSKENEVKTLTAKFYYVEQDIQTIFIGPQKNGSGLAILHNCPQLTNIISILKSYPSYNKYTTVESLGIGMFFGIIGSLSYGVPPMEGYYLESMPTTIRKQSAYLMQQFYRNNSSF